MITATLAQYGMYGMGGYGAGFPFIDPFASQLFGDIDQKPDDIDQRDCRGLPSMRARSICRYGGGVNPMYGGGMYGVGGGCMDMNPQCSVWASTGQCSTNPMMMRTTCALSCGTCTSGLGGSSASLYNLNGLGGYGGYGGMNSLGAYPVSPFMGRSIYETGILRQPNQKTGISAMERSSIDRPMIKNAFLPEIK